MAKRLRVGVIGCGLVAQVMHLHYLRELSDRFEIAAICDLSEEVRTAMAREYAVPEQFATWQELLARPLDAVLVLTSGSHAPIAVAAAKAGMHVLVEKPMCFSVAEGRTMIEAADAALYAAKQPVLAMAWFGAALKRRPDDGDRVDGAG